VNNLIASLSTDSNLGKFMRKIGSAFRLLLCGFVLFALSSVVHAGGHKKLTIALIPGLTTDAFYITMRKGAELAAKGLGVELMFQGAPDFNPTLQVPVLNAVIAK
jgi:ribose transport system substrate-binding protein